MVDKLHCSVAILRHQSENGNRGTERHEVELGTAASIEIAWFDVREPQPKNTLANQNAKTNLSDSAHSVQKGDTQITSNEIGNNHVVSFHRDVNVVIPGTATKVVELDRDFHP